jgi:hypothetical protein
MFGFRQASWHTTLAAITQNRWVRRWGGSVAQSGPMLTCGKHQLPPQQPQGLGVSVHKPADSKYQQDIWGFLKATGGGRYLLGGSDPSLLSQGSGCPLLPRQCRHGPLLISAFGWLVNSKTNPSLDRMQAHSTMQALRDGHWPPSTLGPA